MIIEYRRTKSIQHKTHNHPLQEKQSVKKNVEQNVEQTEDGS